MPKPLPRPRNNPAEPAPQPRRRYDVVDQATGEVLEGVLPLMIRPKASRVKPFFLVVQEGLERIALDDELTHDARRVILLMMANLDYQNGITVSQQRVSSALAMHKSRVSRAVRILLSRGMLERDGRQGRHARYRLPPSMGWKGKLAAIPRPDPVATRGERR